MFQINKTKFSNELKLIAAEKIYKNEDILIQLHQYPNICYTLTPYDNMQSIRVSNVVNDRIIYCFCKDTGYLESESFDPISCLKHSCDPNSAFEKNVYVLKALKTIEEGEMITIHRGSIMVDTIDPFACNCNTLNCKNIIRFDQYKDPTWRYLYSKYIMPEIDYLFERLINKTSETTYIYKNFSICDSSRYNENGKMLIASCDIKKGSSIYKIQNSVELFKFYREEIDDDPFIQTYSFLIDIIHEKEIYGFCLPSQDETLYINHSCDPNAGFENHDPYSIIALRDIAEGQEITIDYSFFSNESDPMYNIECKCNSLSCRKRLLFNEYKDPHYVQKNKTYMMKYLLDIEPK